jgi:hypothetical protein
MTAIAANSAPAGALLAPPPRPVPQDARQRPAVTLGLIFAFAFFALMLRNLSIPAPVCLDEVWYKTYSQHAEDITKTTERIKANGNRDMPNAMLYLHLYQPVHSFGDNAYAAAKVLNVFFFCLAILPVYGTARIFLTRPLALLVVVASLLSGVASCTTSFMPESLYYFLFWMLAYSFLALIRPRPVAAALAAGGLLAALYLVKPHAVMLLVAVHGVLLTLTALAPRLGASWKSYLLALPALDVGFLAALGLLKVLLGHSVTTPVLGQVYGGIAGSVADKLLGNVQLTLLLLGGHLILAGLFLLPPLLAVVWRVGTAGRADRLRVESAALCLLVLWCSAVLIGGTVKATQEFGEEDVHIYQRYYNFIFPLYLIGFYAFSDLFGKHAPRLFSCVCVAGGLALVLGAAFVVPELALENGACPDGFWLTCDFTNFSSDARFWLYVVVCASVAVLAALALFRSSVPHVYTAFFLATALVGTWQNYRMNQLVAAGFEEDVRAARLVNSLLSPAEIENGVVIAPGPVERFAFVLTLDDVPRERLLTPGSRLEFDALPPKTLWVAVKGEYQFEPPAGASTVLCPGWQLILLTPPTAGAEHSAIDVRERGQLLQQLSPEGWRKREATDGVPLREVPVPLTPAAVNEMTWEGGTGAVSGPGSYLEFALPAPRRVAAIQLRYAYRHDGAPANLRALWRRSDWEEFSRDKRGAALKLPTNPGERTAVIWVNDVIDQFRIHPNTAACSFTVAEIVLLVPESGQPQPDTGGGEGVLELADAEFIAGWAWDKNQPKAPLLVDIYDGDRKLATVVADQYRGDLHDAGIGDGQHAFSYRTPASLKDGKPHAIRVKTSGAGRELGGSPLTVTLRGD